MSNAEQLVAALDAWLREQTLAGLMPQADLNALLEEVRGDEAFWTALRPRYDDRWARFEAKLRAEERALNQVLTPEACQRIADAAADFEPDPDAIRTFLRSPAIEETLGNVLYAGISEFLTKADLLGRVVNKLPVLGPIRRKVMAVFKDELEGKLEGQIKSFLGGFSGKAVERMIQNVLSPENREGFAAARRRLAEHLLSRPVKSLVPDAATATRARDQLWDALRRPPLGDEPKAVAAAYRELGEERIADWAWPLSERARAIWAKPIEAFWSSEAGAPWRVDPASGGDADA